MGVIGEEGPRSQLGVSMTQIQGPNLVALIQTGDVLGNRGSQVRTCAESDFLPFFQHRFLRPEAEGAESTNNFRASLYNASLWLN